MLYQQKQLQLFEYLEDQFRQGKNPTTLVPHMLDYASDTRLCLTSVVFIPKNLQHAIEEHIINPLRATCNTPYYYVPNSLHLTIQNIKTVHEPPAFNQETIEKARKIFREVIPKYQHFTFDLHRLFELPTSISLCGFSDAILGKLVDELRTKMQANGIPDDKTYASKDVMFGNISLCRFYEDPSEAFMEKVAELKHISIDAFEVKTISLITTNAVCYPDKTTIIEQYHLK